MRKCFVSFFFSFSQKNGQNVYAPTILRISIFNAEFRKEKLLRLSVVYEKGCVIFAQFYNKR